jgi:hypothetical protein
MRHGAIWAHPDLLRALGEGPKALALQLVPSQYRTILEKPP